jgi:hypothetical protein
MNLAQNFRLTAYVLCEASPIGGDPHPSYGRLGSVFKLY